jgi:hypothetical protein
VAEPRKEKLMSVLSSWFSSKDKSKVNNADVFGDLEEEKFKNVSLRLLEYYKYIMSDLSQSDEYLACKNFVFRQSRLDKDKLWVEPEPCIQRGYFQKIAYDFPKDFICLTMVMYRCGKTFEAVSNANERGILRIYPKEDVENFLLSAKVLKIRGVGFERHKKLILPKNFRKIMPFLEQKFEDAKEGKTFDYLFMEIQSANGLVEIMQLFDIPFGLLY